MFNTTNVKYRIFRFILWLGVFGALYLRFSTIYLRHVLSITESILAFLYRKMVLALSANETLILFPYPKVKVDLLTDLFSIGINVVVAPALVLATIGVTKSGVIRTIGASIMMALNHSLVVLILVFHFLVEQGDSVIRMEFGALSTALVNWGYTLHTSQMNFVMFPFLVWMVFCYDRLVNGFNTNNIG